MMMKLCCFFILMFTNTLALAADIFELKMKMTADNFGTAEVIHYPLDAQSDKFPTDIEVTFSNNQNKAETFTWLISNNSPKDLTNVQLLTYLDLEIEETTNTFFNESAQLVALSLPSKHATPINYKAYTPSHWMMDEPGYAAGQLHKAYQTVVLKDNNAALNDDIALVFQHSIDHFFQGEQLQLTLYIGDSKISGIAHTDRSSGKEYYINSVLNAPMSTALNLPVVTITAPTISSGENITNTTISITDNTGVLVDNVFVKPNSTASYEKFSCDQISATEVNCTIIITSSGTLIITATDEDGLNAKDSESYTITSLRSSPEPVPSSNIIGLLGLISLCFALVSYRITRPSTMKVVIAATFAGIYSTADAQLVCDKPTTQDIPRCVVGFQLRSKPNKVQITWSNNAERYTIYRSEKAGQPLVKLHETSIGETTYLDRAVSNQKNYFYQLQSLDTQGNVKCISETRSAFVFSPLSSQDFNRPPIFDSQPNKRIDENSIWEYKPLTKDKDGDLITVKWINYPQSAKKNKGEISWIANTNESATFTALATDEHGAQTLQQFLVSVATKQQQGNNHAPVITSTPISDGLEEQPYIYHVAAMDCNQDTLTFSFADTVPTGMSIDNSSGNIIWPSPLAGVYPITVKVSDGQLSTTQSYDLTIYDLIIQAPNNQPPRLTVPKDQTLRLNDTGNLAIILQASATDPNLPDDELIFSVTNPPSGLTIDKQTGKINWLASNAGDYLIQVTVTDKHGLIDKQSFTLTILSNLPPVAKDDTYTATSGEVLTITPLSGVMQNDSDPDGDKITVNKILSQPTRGAVAVNPDGSLTYTPNVGGIRIFEDIDLAKHSATITASSIYSSGYPTSNLVNGFLKTPWLTKASDIKPELTATFEHPVTIKQLKLQAPDSTSYLAKGLSIIFSDKAGQTLLKINSQTMPKINDWLTLNIDEFTADNSALQAVSSITMQFEKTSNNALIGIETLELIGNGRATNFVAVEKWRYSQGQYWRFYVPIVADVDQDSYSEVYALNHLGNVQLLSGDTGEVKSSSSIHIEGIYNTSAAMADLDGDANAELLVVTQGKILALNAELSVLWDTKLQNSNIPSFNSYPLSIADLNQDGKPEILAHYNGGICAIHHDGTIFWCTKVKGKAPIVADVNLDGKPEVVSASSILSWDGKVLASTNRDEGRIAVGNLDDDAYPEFVISGSRGYVSILEHDLLTVKKRWQVNDYRGGGSPTIADFDNDGQPEIGVASYYYYQVWKPDGRLLWQQPINDSTSGGTGSTVFDFENDGSAEVVFRDQTHLYIFRGTDGKILFKYPVKSGTSSEYPVIADIDNDGEAEIITTQDIYGKLPDGTKTNPGVIAFESPIGNWVSTRKIWNQYSYHVTNINEDGTIPRVEQNNWLTPGLNNYRQNTWSINDEGQFDRFRYEIIDETGKTAQAEVRINIRPSNTAPAFTSLPTTSAKTQRDYRYAPTIIDVDGDNVTFKLANAPTGMIVDSNTGLVSWKPTTVGNYPVTIIVTDEHGFSTPQSYNINVVTATNANPMINSQPAKTGQVNTNWQYQIIASDIDQDILTYALTESPVGMQINAQNGLINWLPSTAGAFPVTVLVTDGKGGNAEQTFVITISNATPPPSNLPPRIISTPPTIALVGQQWQYHLVGVDDDGAIDKYLLHYSPNAGFDGMTMKLNGFLYWTPTTAGTYQFAVSVVDNDGAKTRQEITLNVYPDTATNYAPEITTVPNTNFSPNTAWQYDVDATDTNGDTLTYTLKNAPTSMTIDAQTGLINWTPTAVDTVSFKVLVSDGNGGEASQAITLTINQPANNAPVINSVPTTSTIVNTAWQYDVNATDIDGDTLTYALATHPAGMKIDTNTGLVTWTPVAADVGKKHAVKITVSDGKATVGQSFEVQVQKVGTPNQAPTITSSPSGVPTVGKQWQYAVKATDADGDTLTYALATHPAGMKIDTNTGLVTWTPVAADFGKKQAVKITVSDGKATVGQSFEVQVQKAATTAMTLSLYIIPNRVKAGETITITVTPKHVSGNLVYRKLWVDNVEVVLNTYGQATITANGMGTHTVRAEAKDDDDTVGETGTFLVIDPNDTTPPEVKIHSPISGDDIAKITSPSEINITAKDVNLTEWSLSVIDQSIPKAKPQLLYKGTTQKIKQNIGKLDPTLLENGIYGLLLTATDTGGNQHSDLVYVKVDGNMKLGHFSLTFNDVNIDTVGIPMTVNRTYDTRRRAQDLSFGHGWSVDYQNVRISENGKLGRHWIFYSKGSGLNKQNCAKPTTGRYVSITLPGNETHEFKMTKEPCQGIFAGSLMLNFSISYTETSNYGSTLQQNDYGEVRYTNFSGTEGIYSPGDSTPVDPQNYILTTREGYKYYIDQDFGLKKIELPSGHSVTYSKEGIKHSNGLSIKFTRNSDDRIEKVTLPDGTTLSYAYDSQGDLITSRDEQSNKTTLNYYGGKFEHYLKDIVDPLGNRAIRTEYDADGRMKSQTDAEGNQIIIEHQIAGKTSTIKDRNGNKTIYVYDNSGNVLSETNALGEQILHTYDGEDNELTTTDALGNTTTMTYNRHGQVLTEENALGEVDTTTYASNHQPESITDALGNVIQKTTYQYVLTPSGSYLSENPTSLADGAANTTTISYGCGKGSGVLRQLTDPEGNATKTSTNCRTGDKTSETDANGVTTAYTYAGEGKLTQGKTSYTDASGNKVDIITKYDLDAKGNVIKTTAPDGSISKSAYNAADQVSSETNALGQTTTYTYTARGEENKVTYPDGTYTQKTYDGEGNVLTDRDGAGRVTKNMYDKANRLSKTTYHDGSSTSQTYYKNGWLKASTNQRGHVTTYTYDKAGRQTKVTYPDGTFTQTEYDKAGKKTATIDAKGNKTTFTYDGAGKVIKTTFADGTTTSQTYFKNGRVKSKTDQSGNTTTFDYDPVGRLISVTDAMGFVTKYEYDEQGNKTAQIDAEGHRTTWAYDVMGRVLSRTLPEGETETFTHDALGNISTHTDFNGDTTAYTYDNMSRQTLVTYADGTTTKTVYNVKGEVESITDNNGTITHTYDNMGRVKTTTDAKGKVIEYAYDVMGNKTKVTSDGVVTDYTYDNMNRLKTVTQNGNTTTYAYDKNGNRESVTYPNGVTTTYTYDKLNRLVEMTSKKGTTVLSSYTYTLAPNGKRLTMTEHTGRKSTYAYDKNDRLIGESITDVLNGNRVIAYTYDKVGNRQQQVVDGVTTVYIYNANDWVQSAGTVKYTYDSNGNTLTETDAGNVTAYVYDKRNKLVKATTPSETVTYQYAPNGLRTQQVVGGVTTNYLVDAYSGYGDVVAEYESGIRSKTYTIGDDLISQTMGTNTFYFGYDGLGSTRMLFDDSASVTDTYDYTAFGEVHGQTGSTDNAYQFTGEQYDDTLGQYYLRARYYNQTIGRFTQLDTYQGQMSDPASLHKYLYTSNNPVTRIDPTGHMSIGSIMMGTIMMGTYMGAVTGFSAHIINKNGGATKPDGVMISYRANVSFRGAGFGGGGDIIYNFRTGDMTLYGGGEASFNILGTVKKGVSGSISDVSAGLVWNLPTKSSSVLPFAGAGASVHYPIIGASILSYIVHNPSAKSFLRKTKSVKNKRLGLEVGMGGFSDNAPAFIKLSNAPSLGADFSYSTGCKMKECAKSLYDAIKPHVSINLNSPSSIEALMNRLKGIAIIR